VTGQQAPGYLAPSRRSALPVLQYDSPSIAGHRVHNNAAPIAPYGAAAWPLAALEVTDRPSRTIHFVGWPEGFQTFARQVAFTLINYGNPESLVEQHKSSVVRWPSAGSIYNILHRLRTQITWLANDWSRLHATTPINVPLDLDPDHLDDLKKWIETRYTEPRQRGAHLADIVHVWHLNPWLPEDCSWPEAPWRKRAWRPKRLKEENKSVPVSELTFQPLLEWAIAFVSSFAPDILRAHSDFMERMARTDHVDSFGAAASLLESYAESGKLLPPKPAATGGQIGVGAGWRTMEYRHGVPARSFSNACRGRRKASLRVGNDLTENALDCQISGRFQGKKWIPFIGVYDVAFTAGRRTEHDGGPLMGHLRTACLIVVAALTGMRPEEVLNLQVGCAPDPMLRPGGSRLQLIHGRVFKGTPRLEDGTLANPKPAAWATIPAAATAIRVAEQIHGATRRRSGLLFADSDAVTAHTPTATGWIQSFIDFVNTRLVPHTHKPHAFMIPSDPSGAVTLRRFRRTLAWYINNRPNGDVTTAIQFQHVGIAMVEGYAGTKESGMPDLQLEEDWNQRVNTIRHLGEVLDAGGALNGPAAERAITAVRQLPRQLTPADERRLTKDPTFAVFDNPAAIALCVFCEPNALCHKMRQSGKDTRPDLLGCVDGCKNCARTDEQLERLARKADGMREEAKISPLPMALSMLAEAEKQDRIVSGFREQRKTLGHDPGV
jgi:hypothetical protein